MATRQLGHNQTEPGAEGFVRIEPSSVRPPAKHIGGSSGRILLSQTLEFLPLVLGAGLKFPFA